MKRALAVLSLVACSATDPSTPPTNVTYTFAMSQFFWGDTSRASLPTYGAWKTFGIDIDGKVTDATSTDVCSTTGVQGDGVDGIDNALGELVVSTMTDEGSPTIETEQQLAAGDWTIQFQVTGLSDDPKQTSTGLSARLFDSARYPGASPPAFDETTDWPVEGAGDPFDSVAVDRGVVTAHASAPIHLDIDHNGVTMPLVLHDATIVFTHASREEATAGTIAGVLDLQEFTEAMRQIAGHISPSLCGSGFDGIAAQFAAAADILKDGSNRAGVACDGISVGFGFTALLVANPTTTIDVPAPVDPCP